MWSSRGALPGPNCVVVRSKVWSHENREFTVKFCMKNREGLMKISMGIARVDLSSDGAQLAHAAVTVNAD